MKDLDINIGLVKIPATNFAIATASYREVLSPTQDFAAAQYGWAQYSAGAVPLCIYVVGMGGGEGKP
jgi:hypothetical protein